MLLAFFLSGVFFSLLEVALESYIILIKLILGEEVFSDSCVETFNLSLLCLAIFFFPSDDLVTLDEL